MRLSGLAGAPCSAPYHILTISSWAVTRGLAKYHRWQITFGRLCSASSLTPPKDLPMLRRRQQEQEMLGQASRPPHRLTSPSPTLRLVGVASDLHPWEGSAIQQSLLRNALTRIAAHRIAQLPARQILRQRCADSQGSQTWTYPPWFDSCVHVLVHAHSK